MTVIAFTTTNNLTPDLQRLVAWAVTEGLAWFLSLSPGMAMAAIWLVVFMVVAGLFIAFDALIRFILRNVEY